MGLFGKSQNADPKVQLKTWSSNIRHECSKLERQIRAIEREILKVKTTLKAAAKKGDKDSCVILAKEIVASQKAITKLHTSKAHLNSVMMQLHSQQAMLRVAGCFKISTEVMQVMQSALCLPEVAAIMRDMSKEMMKAGLIEEMLDETVGEFEDQEELEEEVQKQVDKVLWEITEGQLGEAPAPVTDDLPQSVAQKPKAVASASSGSLDDLRDLEAGLQALRN